MKKKLITAAIVASSFIGGVEAQNNTDTLSTPQDTVKNISEGVKKDIGVNFGFNSLQTSVSHKGSSRIRNFANVGLQYKTMEIGYSGMNEFSENLKNYFGRHVGLAGFKDKDLKLIGVIKTTKDGIVDDKYGLRYIISDKLGVDYGWVDVTANGESGNATIFLGKQLGKDKKTSAELFTSLEIDKKGKVSPYAEVQINRNVAKGLNVFVRGETSVISYKDNIYLVGLSKVF